MHSTVLLLAIVVGASQAHNILVTTMGVSGSQNLLMYRLAEHLADRGHYVTVLKAEVFAEAKTAPLEKAHELKYTVINSQLVDKMKKQFWDVPWREATLPPPSMIMDLYSQVRIHL